METEQREEQCREMEQLIKKLSLTCRSHLDEERDQQKQQELQEKLNGKVRATLSCGFLLSSTLRCYPTTVGWFPGCIPLAKRWFSSPSQLTLQECSLLHENTDDDEEFLQQYRKQRMEEMRRQLHSGQHFKQVAELRSGEAFLDTVDKAHKNTLVVIHIYEDDVPGAESLNGCLLCLAAEYPTVKFCRVRSTLIGASAHFTSNALPALLVYKGGELIGNFVRLTDQLGEDFFAVDLEAFLQECGLLPEKDLVLLTSICNAVPCYTEDSDLEID